jgi:hypothetical protein
VWFMAVLAVMQLNVGLTGDRDEVRRRVKAENRDVVVTEAGS